MNTFKFLESDNVVKKETNVNMEAIKQFGNAWYRGAYFTVSFESIEEKAVIKVDTNITEVVCYDSSRLLKSFSLDVDSEGRVINLLLQVLESDVNKEVIQEYLNNANLKTCNVKDLTFDVFKHCVSEKANIQFIGKIEKDLLHEALFKNGKINFTQKQIIKVMTLMTKYKVEPCRFSISLEG